MKNPNGYGTITKLSGNRRRPFVIREGKTGKQKTIGYAATREEALIILAQYNNSPWNIETDKITLQQLYELWLEKKAIKVKKSSLNTLKSAYGHCKSLANMPYKHIKAYHMQDCIDACELSHATQATIKNFFRHLDRFAMELDIITKCYSELLTIIPAPETNRKVFTDEEIMKIWNNQDIAWVDSVLFLLYTGFRISEMLALKVENIDIESQTMKGGTKTQAGKNRIVPIHSKIRHIVQNRVAQSKSGYLFEHNDKKLSMTYYRGVWADIMKTLEVNHTPHECRHTFRSRLDSVGANKVCVDRIMGHKSNDTGERVYTHKTIEELRKNIELITN